MLENLSSLNLNWMEVDTLTSLTAERWLSRFQMDDHLSFGSSIGSQELSNLGRTRVGHSTLLALEEQTGFKLITPTLNGGNSSDGVTHSQPLSTLRMIKS